MISLRKYDLLLSISLLILLAGSLVHYRFGYSNSDLSGHAWGSDDAYISYRYAFNLAEGHGLVYNPGARVEGYSNFLHVLLISLGFIAGVDLHSIHLVVTFVNTVFMLTTLVAVSVFARRRWGFLNGGAATLILALCPVMWVWASSGLETSLVILLQVGLLIAIDRATIDTSAKVLIGCSILMILLMLVRADGFVAPSLALLYMILRGQRRAALMFAGVLVVTGMLYLFWKYHYYGYLLPNTYYAKVSGPLASRLRFAIVQLAEIAVFQGIIPYLAVIAAATVNLVRDLYRRRLTALREIPFETLFAIGWIGYWLYIGGDILGDRFLLVLVPVATFILFRSNPGLRRGEIFGVLLIALVSNLLPLRLDSRFAYSWTKYDRWITLGEYLAENYQSQSLAIDAAGKAPYYSELRTVDMLGLNDVFIGHLREEEYFLVGHGKFDPDYVIAQRPNLIAAWVAPCNENQCDHLDLTLGLDESRYEAAGYRLRYLLNTTRESKEENIVDVKALDKQAILSIVFSGYGYGVLER